MNVAVIRAKKEMKKCLELKNFSIETENILEWNVTFEPQTTIYKKAYKFIVTLPETYPFACPKLYFTDKVYHPNIDRKGETCIGILNEWQPKYTMETVFNTIQSIFEEPNLDNPINIQAAKAWKNKKLFLSKIKEYEEN